MERRGLIASPNGSPVLKKPFGDVGLTIAYGSVQRPPVTVSE